MQEVNARVMLRHVNIVDSYALCPLLIYFDVAEFQTVKHGLLETSDGFLFCGVRRRARRLVSRRAEG